MRIKKFSIHYTLILGLIGLLFLCCTSMKEFPQAYKGKQLHFGEGGGFTGGLDYFVLFDDGRLFKRAPLDSTYTFQEKWEAPFVKQMFDNIETLQLEQMEFYEPGDKYYFIQFKEGDGAFHRIAWGNPSSRPDPGVVSLYNVLFKSTKSKT